MSNTSTTTDGSMFNFNACYHRPPLVLFSVCRLDVRSALKTKPLLVGSGSPTIAPAGRRKKAGPSLPSRSSSRLAAARSVKDTPSQDQEPAREPFTTKAIQNSNSTHGNGQAGLAREDSNHILSQGKVCHLFRFDHRSNADIYSYNARKTVHGA